MLFKLHLVWHTPNEPLNNNSLVSIDIRIEYEQHWSIIVAHLICIPSYNNIPAVLLDVNVYRIGSFVVKVCRGNVVIIPIADISICITKYRCRIVASKQHFLHVRNVEA